jgi:hypothetical protein
MLGYILKSLVTLILIFNTIYTYGQKPKNNFLLAFIDSSSGQELYGYKNTRGEIAIPAKFNFTYTDTMYDFAIVQFDDKLVGIDRKVNIILEPYIYDNGPDYVEEGLFRFVENNKIGFADINGIKKIPAKFDFASPFKEGMASFNIGGHKKMFDEEHWYWDGGLWGFINKKGKVIIKPEFISVEDFENCKAEVVTQNGKKVLINKKGKLVKTFKK